MPHIHELYDFTVAVFIVHDGKVLLVNHPRYNKWIPPGGHIELDEDPEQALYREIEEETGLKVEILSTKPVVESPETKFILTPNYVDVHEANLPHRHIALTYFARAASPDFRLSAEHTDMRWFMPDELEKPEYKLSPAVQFYAREALNAAALMR
ncbi:MAG TPA: NUDIX domain-containing protein [Candidatus Saccharimonadales bacterium]|nr:NUDIX domain-containing protein [Candidatus Saccharimonadales bacterium]